MTHITQNQITDSFNHLNSIYSSLTQSQILIFSLDHTSPTTFSITTDSQLDSYQIIYTFDYSDPTNIQFYDPESDSSNLNLDSDYTHNIISNLIQFFSYYFTDDHLSQIDD